MSVFNQEIKFVDLEKAYDSVSIVKLWEALERTNIKIYKNCNMKIEVGIVY